MSSAFYIKESINNIKKSLKEDGLEYNKKLSDINNFPKNLFSLVYYKPELNMSMEWNEYKLFRSSLEC